MATIYVDDAAAGANNGTSWTDAYTSIDNANVDGAAVGSEIWVEIGHAESVAATVTLNFLNATIAQPMIIKTIDKSDDSYAPATGITLTTTSIGDLIITGHVRVYGLSFSVDDDVTFGAADNYQRYEDCVFNDFDDIFDSAAGEGLGVYVNCTFVSLETSTGGAIGMSARSKVVFAGCTFTHTATTTLLNFADSCQAVFEDCDLSASSTNLTSGISIVEGNSWAIFRRCKLKISYTLDGGNGIDLPQGSILVESCAVGTITLSELGLTELMTYYGSVTSSTAVYRTGGADDGEQVNAHSWCMVTNANAQEQHSALVSPPLILWVDPDTTPSGATAQGIHTSKRMAIQGTPAPLTTDGTSTWNGSGVGTKQKITHTMNNGDGATLTVYVASGGTLNDDDFWIEVHEPDQVGGPFKVLFFLAKPSTTVYVDPKLEVA